MDILTRPYRSEDRDACLGLFDANVPNFFAAAEREEYASDLAAVDGVRAHYLLLVQDGRVLAAGGLWRGAGGVARLVWGIVAPEWQGQGLGRRLVAERLRIAAGVAGLRQVDLTTSPATQGFYARLGFSVTRVVPDGLAPGLDAVDMTHRP